ncbi:MAG: cytidine deaminase [Lentisphaerae bacterium]|nr:cytidine deaminase [Lentisphaerota bacterium]
MIPPPIQELLEAAALVAARAHCPYSKFHVGSALRATDDRIFTGCNVENASYGLTICAERAALFRAVSAGCLTFSAIAIVADGTAMPYPCGACRQVLAEFCPPHLPVHIATREHLDRILTLTLGELLPHQFTL